jgi:hypothetical protein
MSSEAICQNCAFYENDDEPAWCRAQSGWDPNKVGGYVLVYVASDDTCDEFVDR